MNFFLDYLKNKFTKINETPVIVLGNQKSGTSVISHLLADYGGLSKTIEIPPIWPPVGIKIIKGELGFATFVNDHKSYFATELIKDSIMTFFVEQVIKVFPKARYVFVIRNPYDNIRSLLDRRNIPGNLKNLEKKHFASLRANNRVTVDSQIWGGESENYIGVLALRWNKAVDNYLNYHQTTKMTLAKYEDFMKDKLKFMEKLAKQIEINHHNDISKQLDIQYQPLGKNRYVSKEEFFGRENILIIKRICGSRMEKLGY